MPTTLSREPTPEDIEQEITLQLSKRLQGPGLDTSIALVPYLFGILCEKYKPKYADLIAGYPVQIILPTRRLVLVYCAKHV